MLKTLAEKYGISTTSQTWEVELFNKCCNLFDIERDALDQREQGAKIKKEIIGDLVKARQEVGRLKLYEAFINHTVENDEDSLFVKRLQHKLKKFEEEVKNQQQTVQTCL